MTEIPDEIMAKARDALAADTKFRTKVSQLAAIFLRHDRELAIAAALLSESTASEAASKEARTVARKAETAIVEFCSYDGKPERTALREAMYSLRTFLAKTGGA